MQLKQYDDVIDECGKAIRICKSLPPSKHVQETLSKLYSLRSEAYRIIGRPTK